MSERLKMVKVNIRKKPESHGKQVAAAASLAAAAGAIGAALFTPKTGKQVRGAIVRRTKQTGSKVSNYFKQTKPTKTVPAKEVKQVAAKAAAPTKKARAAATKPSSKSTTPARKRTPAKPQS